MGDRGQLVNECVVGLRWDSEEGSKSVIDSEGRPLTLTSEELLEHPLWSGLSLDEDGGVHVPTAYVQSKLTTSGWQTLLSSEPRHGFGEIPGVDLGPVVRVPSEYADLAQTGKLMNPSTYGLLQTMRDIEALVFGKEGGNDDRE